MLKGKISQWIDEKGFGFIEVEGHKARVFFHISSLKNRQYRPVVGELVTFTAGKDQQGRLRAISVALLSEMSDGQTVARKTVPSERSRIQLRQSERIKIDPPKKNVFDFLGMFLLLVAFGFAGYRFYLGYELPRLWPALIPLTIAIVLLNLPKKPVQSHFSCSKCRKKESFSSRTLEAWRRGTTRLFCHACHQQWLREQPRNNRKTLSSSGSGCLGVFFALLALPVLTGYVVFELLA